MYHCINRLLLQILLSRPCASQQVAMMKAGSSRHNHPSTSSDYTAIINYLQIYYMWTIIEPHLHKKWHIYHCARPHFGKYQAHQLCWADWEIETTISGKRSSWVAGLIHMAGRSILKAATPYVVVILISKKCRYKRPYVIVTCTSVVNDIFLAKSSTYIRTP